MQARNVLYAAVGAPVVAARKVGERVEAIRTKVGDQTAGYGETAERAINGWATEGEKVVSRMSEGSVVEEISAKADLDQVKEQVGKLRDQLEDMLETWRSSFRPEETREKAPAAKSAQPAKKPAANKPAAKKPAAKTTTAKKTTPKKPAAKKTAAKGAGSATGAGKKPASGNKTASSTSEKSDSKAS